MFDFDFNPKARPSGFNKTNLSDGDIMQTRTTFPSKVGINHYSYSVFANTNRKLSGLMEEFLNKGIDFEILDDTLRDNTHHITYKVYK